MCGNMFSCFKLTVFAFILLRGICQWPSNMPSAFSISDSLGKKSASFHHGWTQVYVGKEANCRVSTTRRESLTTGDQHPLLKLTLLILLYVSKVLLHSVLFYAAFTLATDTRCNENKCLECTPGVSDRCRAFCSQGLVPGVWCSLQQTA